MQSVEAVVPSDGVGRDNSAGRVKYGAVDMGLSSCGVEWRARVEKGSREWSVEATVQLGWL